MLYYLYTMGILLDDCIAESLEHAEATFRLRGWIFDNTVNIF